MRARILGRFDETGDTLIEILITLLIMSVTVVSLIAAFSSSIAASSEYRGLAVTDTLVRTVSEQINAQFEQQPNVYLSCPNASPGNYTNGYYVSGVLQNTPLAPALVIPAPYGTPTGNYSATITAVNYWNGTSFGSSCTSGSTVPQEMTISVSGPTGVRAESLSFVVEGNGQSGSTIQLDPPTNLVTSPGVGDQGGIVVNFTNSDNAPNSPGFTQYYTAVACTDAQMTTACSSPFNQFESGGELTGLVPGTPYYVSVYANASPGYSASSTVETSSPTTSSGTSPNPVVVSVVPSTTTAGAVVVSFSPGSAPPGDTFTATACTDVFMSLNCVTVAAANQSGSPITGLTPGTGYYVEVGAAPDGSFTGGTSLPYAPAVKATIQLNAATIVSVSSSVQGAGALVVNFTAPSNAPSPQYYSVTGCTNKGMSSGCVTQPSYVSGNQFSGLVSGMSYYVTVTAVASTGYLASTSAVTSSATEATVQLTAPVITAAATGNSHGRITVTYTGSSNAPANQQYTLTACTNPAMTTGCVTNTNYKTGANESGLVSGMTYYVVVTANASAGYLASAQSNQKSATAS